MNDVDYRTLVYWVPASPLGTAGNRWVIEHRCRLCRAAVATEDLLDHAKNHAPRTIVLTPQHRGDC